MFMSRRSRALEFCWIGNRILVIGNSDNTIGSVHFERDRIEGHLSTKWEKKPMYRLTIEPSDKGRRRVALAVANSPVPLSIESTCRIRMALCYAARDHTEIQCRECGNSFRIHSRS